MTSAGSGWRGIFPSICTPFTPEGDVDVVAQKRVVRFALDGGSHGILAFGFAGEVLKLSVDERERLTDAIIEETAGAAPVFLGVGSESLGTSRRLARYAEQAGADCIVIAAPAGCSAGGSDLVAYFAAIAAEVSVPVMIQDAPAYLGVGLGPSLLSEIGRDAENVQLVKLEAGPAEMGRWIEILGDRFTVWGGDGGVYQRDCLAIGAAGIIPGVDLVDRLVAVYEADADGNPETAAALFERLLPVLVFQMQSIDHYNACAKLVLRMRGILQHDGLRQPSETFSDVSRRLLEAHVANLGL
jgi:dihydrodipicolinate synthase/N-acetylneuraminate lyase